MERRLHIGGREPRAGWEIFNVIAEPQVDHVGNAIDLSRFADHTFCELYASHVLEHFDYNGELLAALKEWRRVLTPGGVLRLSVPDLDILAHLLLQRHTLSASVRFDVMRAMFGGHMNEYDHHRVGLNEDFIKAYLGHAGFVNPQRVSRHGLFSDTSDSAMAGTAISLNMNAYKPLAAQATSNASNATAESQES